MNQKQFNKLTPAQQDKYLINEEFETIKKPLPEIDFNTLVVDGPEPMKKFMFKYSFKKRTPIFNTEQRNFPGAYKAFWAMVEVGKLWKQSNTPIQIIDCYEVLKPLGLKLIRITDFTDEQLGLTKI